MRRPGTVTVTVTAATLAALLALAGCASEPPPAPRKVRKAKVAAPEPPPVEEPPEDKSVAVAAELGVEPAALVWSPSGKLFAAVFTEKAPAAAEKSAAGEAADAAGAAGGAKKPEPQIVVYGKDGERQGTFAPPTPGPIAELAFLGEERLIYLVPPRPPPAARGKRAGGKHKGGKHHAVMKAGGRPQAKAHRRGAKAVAPPLPLLVYAIQPLHPGTPPIVCTGRRFAFSPERDHVAWVVGEPGAEHIAADGVQVYPRAGKTAIQGAPAWSRDGGSLALVQTQPAPQLVVLVEVDNPNGDNSWPLPPEAIDPTLNVFWAGAGTVVVGPALTKPVFAASFKREPNRPMATH